MEVSFVNNLQLGKLFFQKGTKYQNLKRKRIEKFDYVKLKVFYHLTNHRLNILTIYVTSIGLHAEYMSKTKTMQDPNGQSL